MKKLLIVALALSSAALYAIERTPEQVAQIKAKRAAALAAKGGLVSKSYSGNFARIVSTQKKVDIDLIKRAAKTMKRGVNFGIEVSEMPRGECALSDVEKAMKLPATGAVLLVVDDDKTPSLLAAPENAWAILNVHNLDSDFPPSEVYEARVVKELNRGLASAFNAGQSMNKPCVMDPVFKPSDLDKLKMLGFGPEVMSKMIDTAKLRGIHSSRTATYLQAVLEGWAPAPTNDVQKAIWNEAHQLPTAPLKIKPEEKK